MQNTQSDKKQNTLENRLHAFPEKLFEKDTITDRDLEKLESTVARLRFRSTFQKLFSTKVT